MDDKFVGIQVSPISFIDEGVESVLETLQSRVGVNVLMIGTVSWLGLKIGRSISHELDGWPDHGVAEPAPLRGGAYVRTRPEYYRKTIIKDFGNRDDLLKDVDILDLVIPAAKRRGMQVYVELMEPFFKYAGHGSTSSVGVPGLPQLMEVDFTGRIGSEPSTSNPEFRNWIRGMVEDQASNYDIDGVMWCNERKSPLDQLISGGAPGDFSPATLEEAEHRRIDTERVRVACRAAYDFFQAARAGEDFVDGAFVEFWRMLLGHPELLIWERFWLERNKDLDRELYGIVKWSKPSLKFGLNVWNRNHFNFIRKAQWPWHDQTQYADWVKPIVYQHQSGGIYTKEQAEFHRTIFRDVSPADLTPLMYKFLNLDEAPWDKLLETGLDPDTYVFGQCRDTVRGVRGKVPVYMGIGVDAPRSRADQAACTPDIVYRSVMATYRAGGKGVIFAPNYASMKLSNLDGAATALTELGLR